MKTPPAAQISDLGAALRWQSGWLAAIRAEAETTAVAGWRTDESGQDSGRNQANAQAKAQV
jgi:hypothetical protein